MSENVKLNFLAIRYLGLIGEALALGLGTPTADAVKTAGVCCDRIEHIAQLALEGHGCVQLLVGDVQFMSSALARHAGLLNAACRALPTQDQLDDLLAQITKSHDKDHMPVKLGSMLASIAREAGGLTDAEVEHFNQLRHNSFHNQPGESQMNNEDWITHAYPLQQVTIKLQGTRHSDKAAIVRQLETVLARLNAGDSAGQDHDDDFGYVFEYVAASPGPTFFEAPAGSE